jgi:DNA-directed RNA polymerase subunit RPC12/RpoP
VCRVATCEAEGEEQDAGGFADEREARIEARQIACAYCGGKLQARPYA